MSFRIRFLLSFIIAIWITGIFIEFLIPHFNFLAYIYPIVKQIYSTVCHQQPEKLIMFSEHKTMVCARCTGIYLGGFLSSLFLLLKTKKYLPKKFLLLYASLPMFLDVIFYKSGVYNYSKTVAFITGLVFGSIGIVYIYNGLQLLLVKDGKL